MKKNSLNLIRQGKCPRCEEGNIFKYPLHQITHLLEMNLTCPVCDASFQKEPGFYFGAMYVSYAFSVALFTASYVAVRVLANPPDYVYVLFFIGSSFLFIPFSFRYSRILWLYWFGGLSKDKK